MSHEESVEKYLDLLGKRCPRLREITEGVRVGKYSQSEGIAEMLRYVSESEDPALSQDLERMAEECFGGEAPKSLALREIKFPETPLPEFMDQAENGLPRLNPLYEAALMERTQFDGDIPELRFGPLQSGVMPAVPVETKARQPALLGHLLKEASSTIRKEIDVLDEERHKVIEAIASGEDVALMGAHASLVAQGGKDLDKLAYGSAETDHPSYRRGQVPVALTVPAPSATRLLSMTSEEQRENAWKFLSTTQGRRSGVSSIRELIAKSLRAKGYTITEREYDSKIKLDPLVSKEWVLSLSGAGSTQRLFSVVDVAARALAKGLENGLSEIPKRDFVLEVTPVNTIDVREVGWAARILDT